MPVPIAAAGAAASFGRALGESAASTGTNGLINGFLGQLFGGMNARRQWRFQQKQMALQQKYALEQMQGLRQPSNNDRRPLRDRSKHFRNQTVFAN